MDGSTLRQRRIARHLQPAKLRHMLSPRFEVVACGLAFEIHHRQEHMTYRQAITLCRELVEAGHDRVQLHHTNDHDVRGNLRSRIWYEWRNGRRHDY